jgi:hypothetical protein
MWLFEDGRFPLYGLGDRGYREQTASELDPGLDRLRSE